MSVKICGIPRFFCLACVTTKRSLPEFTSQTRKASHSEDVEVTLCEGSLPTWDLKWTSIVSYICRDICERISIWTKTSGNLGVSMILLMVEKSQTTTWDVQNLVNNRIFNVSTGAGFLPSTLCVSKIYNQVSMTGWNIHQHLVPATCHSTLIIRAKRDAARSANGQFLRTDWKNPWTLGHQRAGFDGKNMS